MSYNIILIFIAFLLGIAAGFFDLPLWVLFSVIIVLSLLRLLYMFYILYKTKNRSLIYKFVKANRNNPVYGYAYSLTTLDTGQITVEIDRILKKYKQPKMQALYKTSKALLNEDYDLAKKEIISLEKDVFGQLSLAQIAAMENNREEAKQYKLPDAWMNAFIEAIFALHEKDLTKFEEQSTIVLDESNGLQHFSNFYLLEKMKQHYLT